MISLAHFPTFDITETVIYTGRRWWKGVPVKHFNWNRCKVDGRPFPVVLPELRIKYRVFTRLDRGILKDAIQDKALKHWISPEDIRIAANTRPGPYGEPILTGFVIKPGKIHFRCPWCGCWHYHGWGEGENMTNRQSHCKIYQGGYWLEVKQ